MTDPYSDLVGSARSMLGADIKPLAGGDAGETYLVRVGGDELVLRMYARAPDRAEVDATLLRLVRGLVPVPEVLEVRLPRSELPVALLLVSRLPGERLDLVLNELDADDPLRAQLGRAVGEVLARLSGIPFVAPGWFVAADYEERAPRLDIAPMDADASDLLAWVEAHLDREPFASWPASMRTGLLDCATAGATTLDEVDRTCLVHGDFNPRNLLVDPVAGTVTGLVDWEYAHAGSPVTDLGNLLRLAADDGFSRAAYETLRSLAPTLPSDLVAAARAADLFALVDLAVRPTGSPAVSGARALLSGYARSGSLGNGQSEAPQPA